MPNGVIFFPKNVLIILSTSCFSKISDRSVGKKLVKFLS